MLSYAERAALQTNPIGKKLFELIDQKQSNLALSADVIHKDELLHLANTLGPKLCLLKTHLDIIEDADQSLIDELVRLSEQHQFLIFEDRKFADIGNTTRLQFEHGPFQISKWADMVNFHLIPGPGILDGLKAANGKAERGYIVLSKMSSAGHLFTDDYIKATVELAEKNPNDVIGFITQHKLINDPRFIHFTPGVKLQEGVDELGQRYRTPDIAIKEQGCDVIIVGRGIIAADDPVAEAEAYRKAGWVAYSNKTL